MAELMIIVCTYEIGLAIDLRYTIIRGSVNKCVKGLGDGKYLLPLNFYSVHTKVDAQEDLSQLVRSV